MTKKRIVKSKATPLGVKILSILTYIGSVVTLIFGLGVLFGATFIANLLEENFSFFLGGGAVIGSLLVVFGIIFIALAVLDYFIARGLWRGQNWARILVLIFSVLSLLSSFMPFNVVSIIIDGVIIWYLGFNKEAVAYFR